MKKKGLNSFIYIGLLIALFTTNIKQTYASESEKEKNIILKALSARFSELHNKYFKKKAKNAPQEELHQYEVKLDKIKKYVRRMALGITAASLVAAGGYTAYKSGDGLAGIWIAPILSFLFLAEEYFTKKDKLNVINDVLKLYGKNPIIATPLSIDRYDKIDPSKRDYVYYWLLSGALDQDLNELKGVLHEGGIYDFDEPWIWPALAALYFRQAPTPQSINELQILIEWPKWYEYWKNVEERAQLFGIIPNNQSIKYMESGKHGQRFKKGITRFELYQMVDKKLKEYAEKKLNNK